VVQRLDVLAVQEAQHALLQLAGALARDDFDQRCLLRDRLVDDSLQRSVDLTAAVVDVVQVELRFQAASVAATQLIVG